MKNFLRNVVWILILAAVCAGVYTILPEYPKNYVKALVQPVVNSTAKMRINQVKNLAVDSLEGVTYQAALEKNTGMSCWVYDNDEETGKESVTYYGRGASVNMKDYKDYNGKLYTSCAVKYVFEITGNNVVIYPYLDGVKMNIEDGAHVEQNKEVRKMIIQQLYAGIQEE